MKKDFVDGLNSGNEINSVFMLRDKTKRLTKKDKPYLILKLADKTGTIEGRVWDDAERKDVQVDTGDVVNVTGSVEEYQGTKQLKVNTLRRAEEGSYEISDLIKVFPGRDRALESVRRMLLSIENRWIKKLAHEFLKDEKFLGDLRDGAGGKMWHNAYVGGLIEHIHEVMYIADQVCGLYPEADRDVTVFGAFLHDLGKVRELDSTNMVYTDEGGLVGHIAIGFRMLTEKIGRIKGFPQDLAFRLEHIVLSHHGEYEQQSPVLPKTLEATIVYHADDLVSQANAIKELQAKERQQGRVWSDYVFIKNRKYYVRPSTPLDENTPSAVKREPETEGPTKTGNCATGDLFDEGGRAV